MANMAGYSSHHLQPLAVHGTQATILCCICSSEIPSNPANMCVGCLRQNVDITDGINRQLTMHSCRGCGRFLCPPWQSLQLESKELLAACLRKIPGLNKVKLIDAVWIWTEPHSMRLKIKITVQKEVMNGAILQQAALIDFTIRNQQCKNCEASYAQGVWHAVVQVRQRVPHKRTFFYLEQLLLKHGAHSDCINIVQYKDGMDFYFRDRQPAVRFLDFLSHHVPTKSKYARKLVSADHSDNVGDFKHNYMVEIVPVCKDDLVVLPRPLAASLSDANPLSIVRAVGAEVHVVDPSTGERHEISVDKYWRHEFTPVMASKQLVPYVVLSVEYIIKDARPSARKRGAGRKMHMAECVVAKESDLGVNDTTYTSVTHLGYVLKSGDTVMGYDLAGAAWAQETGAEAAVRGKGACLPDVVLVRKRYANRGERLWALRQLEIDERAVLSAREQEAEEAEYEEFLQQVEGDKEMRQHMQLFRAERAAQRKAEDEAAAAARGKARIKAKGHRGVAKGAEMDDDNSGSDNNDDEDDEEDEEDEEQVQLEELLDDLAILDDQEDSGAGGVGGYGNEETSLMSSARVLSAAEASQQPALDYLTGGSGFEGSNQDPDTPAFSMGGSGSASPRGGSGGKKGAGKGGGRR